ncbi:MAG: hypothetical protein WC617_17690 [Rhodanobacter sp.]
MTEHAAATAASAATAELAPIGGKVVTAAAAKRATASGVAGVVPRPADAGLASQREIEVVPVMLAVQGMKEEVT